MLDQNWEPNDHQIVLNWFERELDRYTRHRMQSGLEAFWEHHPLSDSLRAECSYDASDEIRELVGASA